MTPTTQDMSEKMTPEEKNRAVAECMGDPCGWLLLKRGLYWRPHGKGYTSSLKDAGIYRDDELYPWMIDEGAEPDDLSDPKVFKRRAPVKEFTNDLNAMHEAEKTLSKEECERYGELLAEVPQMEGWAGCTIWHIEAAQRVDAFLITKGKMSATGEKL